MPERDSIHETVKQALRKDGWQITDDPYVISYGERFLFVDLGASEEPLIGAQREGRRIAVEIKEFRGRSAVADLEQAIGQYILYQLLLDKVDPGRDIYLAVTDITHDELFNEPLGELVIDELPLQLLIINVEKVEIQEWIPPHSIVVS
jgi:hypothetical protein